MIDKCYTHEEALIASLEYFNGNELAASVYVGKYALRDKEGNLKERTPTDTHRRLAKEFARIEAKYPNPLSEDEIFAYFDKFSQILPQGSPMAGIGNPYYVTSLSNCFVIPSPRDSYGGILYTDQQQIQIMKRRGGVGFSISTLRPQGTPTANAAITSSGLVGWIKRYANSCGEVGQDGRRGALLLALAVTHPEVMSFITIKRDPDVATNANISIQFTNKFMRAVKKDQDFILRFPVEETVDPQMTLTVKAREIWDEFIHSAWLRAEPGALFWDTVLERSPADIYRDFGFGSIATNPCGEIVLSAYDSCRLIAMNLFYYVRRAYLDAEFDYTAFAKAVEVGQRLMDDLVDLEIEAVQRIINKVDSDPEPQHIKQIELDLWNNIL
jgi:ribonucleoside-diphosphate reductase alpha chain